MKKITTLCLFLIKIPVFISALFLCEKAFSQTHAEATLYLPQGWDHKTRQQLSFTSFGSRFIPYDWFLALEQADSQDLLRDNRHLAALGFITTTADEFNPEGLPVGFARDEDKKNGDYIGLTCAACHTGQVSIHGKRIRIDGGQSLINFTEFELSVLNALRATLADSEKFSRFSNKIIAKNTDLTVLRLQAQMHTRATELQQHITINKTDVPYGKGRLDAFGHIFNAIAVEALNIPENIHSPNAPTSFPMLWDASHLDLVQWNGSAPNKEPGPLFQNAITALAVYGSVSVLENKLTYPSSIRINNLGNIQRDYYELISPKWPVEYAGQLDSTKIAKGKLLYEQHCLQCHTYVDSNDKKRKLRAVLTPVAEVGTDSLMSNNFENHQVKTGVLEGERELVFAGNKFTNQAKALDVVTHTAAGALFNQPWQTLKAIVREFRSTYAASEKNAVPSYKARPINGIWASAPYLHNGSVPSIYDLLLPPGQRPENFYVGNTELDLVKVGYVYSEGQHTTFYDTHLLGNSNAGHEYGTQLADEQRWELVEYLKSL